LAVIAFIHILLRLLTDVVGLAALYTEQDNVDTKALLGHRDDRTAAIYGDSRGAEWIAVKVG